MNIILIAAPAAGKGTIARLINEKYGWIGVSPGELLRAVDRETEMGQEIDRLQREGILVSDDITGALMKERLSKPDIKTGAVLDGYPRRMRQVNDLEKISEELNLNITCAVYLNVSYETALKRTLGRRLCPSCNYQCNVLTGLNYKNNNELCDKCNSHLSKRDDDTEETLKTRFNIFQENSLPVIEHYRNIGKLVEIDANNDAEVMFSDIEEALGLKNDQN